MAEAIGIVSSVAQLVQVATSIAKFTYSYIVDVRNASRVQKAYLQEVSALVDVLLRLEQALQDSETFSLLKARPTSLSSTAIADCQQNLTEQHAKLEKHIHRLIWPFQDRDLRRAIDDVHRFRTIFADFAIANTSLLSSATLRAVDTLKQSRERSQILEWLDPGEGASKVKPDPVPNTGSWLVAEPVFKEWSDGLPSSLWCFGAPGVGKSLLASIAVDKLSENATKDSPGVLHYFCEFTVRKQQTELALLQSILRQMIESSPQGILPVLSICFKEASTAPKADELFKAIKGGSSQRKFFLVIDAPDELDSLRPVIARLQSLIQLGWWVLITSRDHPDIREKFSSGKQLEVHSRADDMDLYIQSRFQDSDFRDIVVKGHTIVEAIIQKANSLFLLAKLVMDRLLELPTIKQMRKSLTEGPTQLQEAYESSLKRIDAQPKALRDMAHRLIAWVIHAGRPLRSEEILHAFAIEPEDDDIDDENFVAVQTLLRACAGVVIIDPNRMTLNMVHTTAYEFFQDHTSATSASEDIARTTLTYLCLKPLRSGACDTIDALSRRSTEMAFLGYAARNWGKHVSFAHLEEKLSGLILKLLENEGARSSAFQVLQYRPGLKSQEIAEAVFMSLPKQQTALHVAAYWGLQIQTNVLIAAGVDVNAADSQNWTPIHWAASGSHKAIIEILLKAGANIDSRDSQKWTPLFWTSFRGASSALQLLLDSGANHLLKDVHGWTALHWAVSRGEGQIVTALLEHHTSYAARAKKRTIHTEKPGQVSEREVGIGEMSALELAADMKNTDLFDVLLKNQHETNDKSLNVSWTSGQFDPPTSNMWRAYNKSEDMYGVDRYITEDEWTGYRRTQNESSWKVRLLHAAIRDEQLSVMQLLLETGVEVNLRRTRTALHAAAFREDPQFAQILLEHGADPSLKDDEGQTALHQAVLNGFEDTILVLLRGGSDVNNTRRNERARFHVWNYSDGRQLSINKKGASEMTTLMLACGYEHRSDDKTDVQTRIIALLLSHGANPGLQDDRGRNCLHYAPSTGDVRVTQMLIDSGIDVNIADQKGMTALHHAAEFGDLEILRTLIQAGAVANTADAKGATPLDFAARCGSVEIIRELLAMGQDANHQDGKGVTILHHMAKRCNSNMVRLLVDHGARLDLTDTHGCSAVHYLAACKEGETTLDDLQTIFNLLYTGKDVSLLNREYDTLEGERYVPSYSYPLPRHTVLSMAIENSNWRLFHIFKEAGAVSTGQISGLLRQAVHAIQPHVVQHLLENGAELTRKPDSRGRITPDNPHLQPDVDPERLDGLLHHFDALGLDINERSYSDQTLLSQAAISIKPERVAEVLVKRGANPYMLCRGLDSIILAAVHKNHNFLRGLLANLPASCAEGHWSQYLPLREPGLSDLEELAGISKALKASEQAAELKQAVLTTAVMEGHVEFAKSLIAAGLDIDVQDGFGWTPLHHAILTKLHSVVKLLLEAGADVNTQAKKYTSDRKKPSGLYSGTEWTGTPLHVAVLVGDEEATTMLLERGADVNASTGVDRTFARLHGPRPLHIALGTGAGYGLPPNLCDSRLRIAEILVEKGAKVTGVGDHLTPGDLIHFKGHEQLWETVRNGLTGSG